MAKYRLGDIYIGDFPTTQRWGENPANYPMFAIPGHEGWDIGTPNGTPVIAPFNGKILRDTFNDKDYGNFTVIWDPTQHCAVWYCHLQDVTTHIGDTVTQRQVVGHTNNTGHSSGPHLHVNFVETDALGNRLNLNNGKQGFLNILDPNLVEWVKSDVTMPGEMAIQDQTHIPLGGDWGEPELQSVRSILNDQKNAITARDSQINDLTSASKQQGEIIVGLQQQLTECQTKSPEIPNPSPTTDNGSFIEWLKKLFKWS